MLNWGKRDVLLVDVFNFTRHLLLIFASVGFNLFNKVLSINKKVVCNIRSLISILFLITAAVSADEPNPPPALIWGLQSFPPYQQINESGDMSGLYIEIITGALKHAGVSYEVIHLPKKRAVKMVQEGLVSFSIGPSNTNHSPELFFQSKAPFASIKLHAYWQGPKKPIHKGIDLKNSSVILISTYRYSGLRRFIEDPKNNVTLAVEVEDHQRALQALELGRADYMLGYAGPVKQARNVIQISELQSSNIIDLDMYFFLHKSMPNGREIMDKLNASYATLYGDAD